MGCLRNASYWPKRPIANSYHQELRRNREVDAREWLRCHRYIRTDCYDRHIWNSSAIYATSCEGLWDAKSKHAGRHASWSKIGPEQLHSSCAWRVKV